MKKICFITTVSNTLRAFVLDTAKYLYEYGKYDITFICSEDQEFSNNLPSYIHYIPVPMSRGVNLKGFGAIKELKKIFTVQKFDIVQYSTPNASFYASVAAKSVGIPVRLYCQWGIRYVGFSGIPRLIFKILEKIVCDNSTIIRAVSQMNKEFAISEGLYKAEKVKVLGKGGTIGIDLSEYDLKKKESFRKKIRQKYNCNNAFVFGFVGRLTKDKGCNELLKAFKLLCSENNNLKLLLVGDMEAENKISAQLLEWAKNSENVIFTGRIVKREIPQYYAAMDAYVHPTYREGFGMVLQEAAAMELPIITTKIPGASEVMEDGKSCILCEAQNANDLAEKMNILVNHPQFCFLLAKAARRRVEKYFERSIMLRQQFLDYESM